MPVGAAAARHRDRVHEPAGALHGEVDVAARPAGRPHALAVPENAEARLRRGAAVDAVGRRADVVAAADDDAPLRLDADAVRGEVPGFDAEEVGEEIASVERDEEREGEELREAELGDGVVVRLLEDAEEDRSDLCRTRRPLDGVQERDGAKDEREGRREGEREGGTS